MNVQPVSLCEDGPELSEIAYGTWRILNQPTPNPKQLAERLENCHALGITTLDTAEIYGSYQVESLLGRALAEIPEIRDRSQIVTKCGIDVPSAEKPNAQLPQYNASADNLVRCAEKSLSALGIDAIDVFLVHRPDWFTPAEETAKGLTQLIEAGKIKYAGVSNYTSDQFDLLQSNLDSPLVTNQVEINLLAMQAMYDGTLNQCEQYNIRPMAWSVLAGGELFNPENEASTRIHQVATELSEKYDNASIEALVTAWVMALPSQPIAIVGSNQLKHIHTQAKAASIKLDRNDWYSFWTAATGNSVP